MRAGGVKYPRRRRPVLRRFGHRRRLDVDWTNEPDRRDGCDDLAGWLFDIHPAETNRAEVTRQAAAGFARQQVNKAA